LQKAPNLLSHDSFVYLGLSPAHAYLPKEPKSSSATNIGNGIILALVLTHSAADSAALLNILKRATKTNAIHLLLTSALQDVYTATAPSQQTIQTVYSSQTRRILPSPKHNRQRSARPAH
jgi:hypothetical protein